MSYNLVIHLGRLEIHLQGHAITRKYYFFFCYTFKNISELKTTDSLCNVKLYLLPDYDI